MSRTLVIGDIHGGLKAVVQVLERAKVTSDDILIFLGDYVDGWSQSPEVLDFLIDLSNKQKCIFIRGNHDELVLDWLEDRHEHLNEEMWFKHGGKATVDAYKNVSVTQKEKHIQFLKSLKNYHLDEMNRLFVHAGFTNMNGVTLEYFPKMLYWDRTLWEMALCLDENMDKNSAIYPKRFKIYSEIYIGHSPLSKTERVDPEFKNTVWNLDTGAAFKGALTIMDVDTKDFWQSDVLSSLYPDEMGRN
ncbi:metallophosphoesterase family protein [Flavobacterium urocaniciphilum]|uniref:Serine/threonine protein phosphatase 1 n=1 Tax=Flavobacterium urocaniciphilum TaxID=1299341 RepID=A0A1H9E2G4_9FLAO|nr:metallophosphoesterase family protein [Flavobacterium urocaniciphilum]SEQ19845.1 serine/threonine protein phosphatase 1 [Flavobacterium urocaniciphilum]